MKRVEEKRVLLKITKQKGTIIGHLVAVTSGNERDHIGKRKMEEIASLHRQESSS